ncbi:MAG TPA: terminase TerL endonuclease subunit [Clostridia bacterium]|nr:terminase TerL endonuclease subunit [Clostridia bacterium]
MIDRATEYAIACVQDELPVGKMGRLHKLACRRHLEDLDRLSSPAFPYDWKPDLSERILDYSESLTIAEGMEPRPVRLHKFQTFDLGTPFGWVRKDNGYKRFRRSYKSMARQNGKTFQNGITGSYIAGFSGYQYGRLFTAATKKRQSKLAWDEIAKFIRADPDLSELFRVQDYIALITALQTNCTIEALSKEGGLDDGFRSIYSSVDEIHQLRDNSIYKSLYNGTRSLAETLVSMITTRGFDLTSFCKEMDDYCVHILEGTATAEDFFVDIYCLDDDDDWYDPANYIKANPHIASTPEGLEVLIRDAQTARDQGGSELRDFVTKALNLWFQSSDESFVIDREWKACATRRPLEAFRGEPCTVGLDLSHGGDLTTLALEFEQRRDERLKYYLYSHSFMPRARLAEHIKTDIAPYDDWERMGLITITGGAGDYKNDYHFIVNHLAELRDQYDLKIRGIGYDPHNADAFLADLSEFDCPLIEIRQSARALNDGTDHLRLSIRSGEAEYDERNELLTWSALNAKIVRNSFGEMKIDKEPSARYKRIDPIDAAIDAHIAGMKVGAEITINYENEMKKYLERMMGGKHAE